VLADAMVRSDDVVYWDWNATTPPHPDVLVAMQDAFRDAWANSSSQHRLGRAARARIEGVREQIGELLAVHPRDVLFVASGTEANNLALRHAAGLVVSRLDHPSVVRVAEQRAAEGTPVLWVPVAERGQLDPRELEGALEALPDPVRSRSVVVITAANHETGVLQDVNALGSLVRARGARLHCDASQAIGKIAASELLGADSWTVSAHKLRGPQGVAALAWKGAAPVPVLLGGSQERGLRPGTPPGPLIAGFGAALARLDPRRYAAMGPLRDKLELALRTYGLVNGAGAPRLPHVSNISFAGWTGERLVAALDVRGVCVSTGSACRVGTAEPSAAVAAMLGAERARGAVRFSLGEDADEAQLDSVLARLFPLLQPPAVPTS
jgi:cysteine desulfurase